MKILVISHSANLMGAERSLLAQAEELMSDGHHVIVAVPREGPLQIELNMKGVTTAVVPLPWWMGERHVFPISIARVVLALVMVIPLRNLVKRVSPDLVITNSAVVPSGAIAARILGIPHVWVVRESIATNPTLRSFLGRRVIAKIIVNSSVGVIAVSDYVKGQLLGLLGKSAGKDQQILVERPYVRRSAQIVRLSPEGERLRVACVGSVSREKGQEDLVLATASCRAMGVDVEVLIVGGGASRNTRRLKRLTDRLAVADLFQFIDWVEEPWAILGQVDLIAMISRNEAFGRVTAEAIVHGIPVLAYDAGATREILGDCKGASLIAPSPNSLARALQHFSATRHDVERLRLGAKECGDEFLSRQEKPATQLKRLIGELSDRGVVGR